MKKEIKKVIKRFVDYTIKDDVRIYQIKHTPIKLKKSLTKAFLQEYGTLAVIPDKIVCCNYRGSGYGCNCKYVTEALLRNGRQYDIVWVVKDAAERKQEFPKGVRLVEYGSKMALHEYATAGIWLCNYHLIASFNQGLMKKETQHYIQMWHGSFGIKKIENDCSILYENKSWAYLAKKNAKCTDYWISNSSFETEVYKSAFWGAGTVLEYGHPRNDIFFGADAHAVKRCVNSYLGIADTAKTLLYVPTFREEKDTSADRLDVSMVLAALKKKTGEDWIFAVRFHPRMGEREKKAFLDKWKNVKDATEYPDIQELLLRADAALTDYSSSVFDFLLSRKMAFLFVPDRDAYTEERGFYYPLEESPFPVAGTNEELCEAIITFDKRAYEMRIRSFLEDKGAKETGHAASRVAGLIEEIVLNAE